ncbi:MAG: Ig-like domain-containing protein, partial [Oscillospiraceae bacterium]|nr:Ig-like domain-containing protein [Oscillospiraceae bacterium]
MSYALVLCKERIGDLNHCCCEGVNKCKCLYKFLTSLCLTDSLEVDGDLAGSIAGSKLLNESLKLTIDFQLDAGSFYSLEPTMLEGSCDASFYYSFNIIPADGSESFQTWKRFDVQNEENYVSFVLPKEYIDTEVYYMYQIDKSENNLPEDATLYTGEVYLCQDGSMVTSREEADTFTVEDWNEVAFEFIEDDNITPPVTPDVPEEYFVSFSIKDEDTNEAIPNATVVVTDTSSAATVGTTLQANDSGWAQGTFAAGKYTVTASADGYIPTTIPFTAVMNHQAVLVELQRIEIDIAENTTFTVRDGDTESTPVIAGASLTITDADGNAVTRSTDASGKASADLENGTYTVGVIADGYQARSFKIERSDTNNDFTVYLNKDEIIKVTSTVKEMTKEEIENAGISVDENRHVYNCSAVLTFMPDVVINYIYSDDGKVLDGKTVVHDNVAVTPVARDIFLIVKSSTAWLKEIFEVQLVCDNTSAVETIESLTANMALPNGLSLAKMAEGEQSESVNLGNVAPKGNVSHKWYICGDEKGEYKLSGTLTGTRVGGGISENINLGFSIEEPITVIAGEAMELTIDAETHAIAGSPYRMRYTLENVSGKSLYDLSFTVFGGKFFEDYKVTAAEYAREYGPDAMTDENLDGEGFLFETEEFKPGEKISGVFTITFGEGLQLGEGQGWHLTDAFVVTGAGSTTEIPTTINWISVLPVHNWDGGTVTIAPTCTTAGVMTYTCSDVNCDIKTYTEIIPATGHDMGDYVTTEPTCTEDGTKVSTCKNNCGHTVTLTSGKLGHDMGDWVTTVEPGCESTGTKRRDCSRCDHFETEQIPATDHKWDEGKVTTPPTAEKEGERTFTCENGCGKTKTEAIPKLVPQEVEFLFSELTITYGDENAIYNEAYNESEDGGAISYTSSDESVATVDEKGKVTIVGAGETTITATAAATEIYTETSASYKLIVKKAPLTVKPKTVEIFYGEAAAFSEVEGEGFVLGEDVSVLTGDAVFATEYKAFDSVGEYQVTVSGITAKNYEITFAPGVLNVKKAEKYEIVLSMLTYRKGDEIKPEIAVTPADPSAEFKLEYNVDVHHINN